jgi:rhodanese-related sulfurtransferase
VVLSEDQEQFRFVTWFKNTHKGVRIFAIPNGGWRSKATASLLKSTGVSPGVPDLYIPAWKLWIEMKKTKGGVVSQEQKEWIAYLNEIGDTAVVCRGWMEARRVVEEFVNKFSLVGS